MTIDTSFSVKKLKKLELLYVAFSGITRLPYIACDEETYDDEAFIFSTEEAAKAFADSCKEKNTPIMLAKIETAKSAGFFVQLYSLNANAVKFHDGAGDTIIQLEEIAPAPDWEKMKKEPIPIMNPSLSLPVIYFLEELRRPNQNASDPARMQKVRELEEEMIANLIRSKFLIIFEMVQVENEKGEKETKAKIPFIKAKNGNTYQPIFSCLPELQRFMGNVKDRKNNVRVAVFPELPKLLAPESNGYLLDPNTLNLVLSKDHVTRLAGKIQVTPVKLPTAEKPE